MVCVWFQNEISCSIWCAQLPFQHSLANFSFPRRSCFKFQVSILKPVETIAHLHAAKGLGKSKVSFSALEIPFLAEPSPISARLVLRPRLFYIGRWRVKGPRGSGGGRACLTINLGAVVGPSVCPSVGLFCLSVCLSVLNCRLQRFSKKRRFLRKFLTSKTYH